MKKHQKHAKLVRPDKGSFSKSEWAIMGTPCGEIKQMSRKIIQALGNDFRLAYVDADHKGEEDPIAGPERKLMQAGGALGYTDKISFGRFDYLSKPNSYHAKPFFNLADAVIVNGNHFKARRQILVIDPRKSLEKKLEKITDVMIILFTGTDHELPAFLTDHIGDVSHIPQFQVDNLEAICDFLRKEIEQAKPELKGLVLAGGKSVRMKQDKGLLNYHGKPQREYAYDLLKGLGLEEVFVSVRPGQIEDSGSIPGIEDKFLGLGPMGGILSAFREDPNAAWLVIACDLPYLSAESLDFLIKNRNSSQTATAFQSPHNEFPEPLISIWEPRAYATLLAFLAEGYSCPRKVLINSDIELLQAPQAEDLTNVNLPEEYARALEKLGKKA